MIVNCTGSVMGFGGVEGGGGSEVGGGGGGGGAEVNGLSEYHQ